MLALAISLLHRHSLRLVCETHARRIVLVPETTSLGFSAATVPQIAYLSENASTPLASSAAVSLEPTAAPRRVRLAACSSGLG